MCNPPRPLTSEYVPQSDLLRLHYIRNRYLPTAALHTDTDGAILGSLGPTPFSTTDRILGHGIRTTDIDTQRDRQTGRQTEQLRKIRASLSVILIGLVRSGSGPVQSGPPSFSLQPVSARRIARARTFFCRLSCPPFLSLSRLFSSLFLSYTYIYTHTRMI